MTEHLHNAPAVVDELVRRNQGLVHTIARECRWSQLEYEDLIAAGNEGLLLAAQRYDERRGAKFSTFAVHWIRAFLWRFVENNVHLVRIPVHMQQQLRAFRKGTATKTSRFLQHAIDAARGTVSLDAPIRGQDDDRALSEVLAADAPTPEELVGDAEEDTRERRILKRALARMPERLRRVVEQRHLGEETRTLGEVGKAMGLSRERVRQLEVDAMKVLKKEIAEVEKTMHDDSDNDVADDSDEAPPAPPAPPHYPGEWITTKQAAELLGVGVSWFPLGRDRVFTDDAGEAVKLEWKYIDGGLVRYRRESVLRLARLRQERAAPTTTTIVRSSGTAMVMTTVRHSEGRKDDQGKLRYSLLPVRPLRRIVEVLEFGARKYGVDNWQKVAEARSRYTDALMRHVEAWRAGEMLDPETKLPHLAHAAANCLFLLWFDGDR